MKFIIGIKNDVLTRYDVYLVFTSKTDLHFVGAMQNLFLQLCFFVGAWIFFMKQLFKDYEVRHIMIQLIFSITLTLSCTMFELIILEILGWLESRYIIDYFLSHLFN